MDCEEISIRKIRRGTTKLIDVQRANVTPVAAEDPAVIIGYQLRRRVISESVDPCLELRLILVGSVQLESKITGSITELRPTGRFRRVEFDEGAERYAKRDLRCAKLPKRFSRPRKLEEFHLIVVGGLGSGIGTRAIRDDRVLDDEG